ncbi:MAG: hypothetical protein JNM28_02910 [Armatimonadetes bacterium]|nr:hypothetical protein [Armatimonadota bacterium]
MWRTGSGVLRTFTYDAVDRLTEQNTSGPATFDYFWEYDAAGNRTFSTEQGSTHYSYNLAGQAVTISTDAGLATQTFDDNGNLIRVWGDWPGGGKSITMSYDKENRLDLDLDSGARTTYTYSGDGLKRSEATGSGRTTIVWDGSEYLQGRD